MKRSFSTKLLSLVLAVATAIPSFSMPVQAAEPLTPKYQYDFEENLTEAGGEIVAVPKMQGDTGKELIPDYEGDVVYIDDRNGTGKALDLGKTYGLEMNIPAMGEAYTVSLWINPQETFGWASSVLFIGEPLSTGNGDYDWISLGPWNLWGKTDGNNVGGWTSNYEVSYTQNEWQQFILSVDNGSTDLYKNGEIVLNDVPLDKDAFATEVKDLYIGVNNWDALADMYVDEVRVYDRAITALEAKALYTGGFAIAAESTSVNVGETVKIEASVADSDAVLEWISSDEAIATVENGVVTGVADGSVVITAELKKASELIASDSVAITVNTTAEAMEAIYSEKIADFTFDDAETGFAGAGAIATPKNGNNGNQTIEAMLDAENGVVKLANNNYLSVTKEDGTALLAGLEEIMVSFDVTYNARSTSWPFFANIDANNPTSGHSETYLGMLYNGSFSVERFVNGRNGGAHNVNAGALATNTTYEMDIVFANDYTAVFVDGQKIGQSPAGNHTLTAILKDTSIVYLGKATWGEYCNATMDNFSISVKPVVDKTALQEAVDAAIAEEDAVKYTEETWKVYAEALADAKDVLAEDAAAQEAVDAAVKALADAKTALELVPVATPEPTPEPGTLEAIEMALAIPNADAVRGNITLIDELDGASITWKSSNPAVVTDTDADGKAAGVVTRGAADQKVTLTATITLGEETATKDIEVTVKAAPAEITEDDYVGYLFGHFIGEGGADQEQIYFATSSDGRNFTDMNEGKPVIVSDVGEKGLRDPYMMRSPEGDRFFIVATDLSIYHRGGWKKNEQGYYDPSTTGSHYLVVYESTDLVNWGAAKHIKVAPENAGMAWAPEMIYHEETGQYIIFFASSIMNPETKYKDKPNAIYYVATRDFVNFSETKLLIDNQTDNIGENGKPREIIDTTIIKLGDYYYSASKDGDNAEVNGGIRVMRSKNLLDPTAWEKVYDLDELGLDLTGLRVNKLDNSTLEGPEFFRFNKKDWEDPNVPEYGLFADQYAAGAGYLPIITTDITDADNSENSWKILQPGEYSFDLLKKRHGTIVNLTQAELDRVNEAYANGEQYLKDKEAMIIANKITIANQWNITENINLVKELDGATITWESSNPDMITTDGVVTRGETNQWVTLTATVVTPEGGTATKAIRVRVTKAEQVTPTPTPEPTPVPEKPELLADFNFDTDGEFFDGGYAKATGTYSLVDYKDGKALKLDGNQQFLTVTDKNGGSLLTGLDELTVSFQFNPESSATNWGFFAAPNTNQQQYMSEKYIGIFDNNGAIGAERYYSNNQDRPANPNTTAGYGNWYHVTVVYTATETILYLNGVEAAREASVVDISDLLGANSVLYIGKSTWLETGEYYTGLIDNYKIYGKVLTPEEIKAEANKYIDRSALEAAIAEAAEIKNEDDYTPGTWAAFQEALAAAKEVLANKEASQTAINDAASALTSAQGKLTAKADMSALQALVEEAKKIDTEGVDPELVEDLEKEIADAEKVLANADARQAAVDSAVKQLQKAMDTITDTPDPTPTPDPFRYDDVFEGDWFWDAVYYCYDEGLMTGMTETSFGPYGQLSRAQFALILYRMAGEPEVETDKSFTDITGDEWYGQAVLWAAEAEVVNGYLDGNFGPADNITREQMALMMYRYANYLEKDTTNEGDLSKFSDGETVSPFATDALKWAADKGIITGKGSEEPKAIDPQGETARCEAAAIIQRFMIAYAE